VGELGVLERLDASEVAIDEGCIRQRPGVQEVCGGLESGGVWWQEQQAGVLRYPPRRLAHQRARSSTSTIGLVGLTPTARANAASSTVNRAMLTEVARGRE
jgi:hypothetical protein